MQHKTYIYLYYKKKKRLPSALFLCAVHDEDNDNTELSKSMLYVNNF